MRAGDHAIVERALRYPFERHRLAAVLSSRARRGSAIRGATAVDLSQAPARHELALLAYGANAAPARLALKLRELAHPWRVVIAPAQLRGFDIVYSAHVSPYGPIPSTLLASPGTTVAVHVLFLDAPALAPITATEWNYRLGRLDGADLDVEGAGNVGVLHAFASRHGALTREGAAIALAALPARGRTLPELAEPEMLDLARERLAPQTEIGEFILGHVGDPALQLARTVVLRSDAAALRHHGWTPLDD